jgi:hypothetical protein
MLGAVPKIPECQVLREVVWTEIIALAFNAEGRWSYIITSNDMQQ